MRKEFYENPSHKTHGDSHSTEYSSWMNMMYRCYNPKSTGFDKYGGRGIEVCERWHTYQNFLEDMGRKPEGTSLDRKDVNGNYSKENCRWASAGIQIANRGKVTSEECTSKYPGVSRDTRYSDGMWIAKVGHKGKSLHLGTFNTEKEAFNVYKKVFKELYGFDKLVEHLESK